MHSPLLFAPHAPITTRAHTPLPELDTDLRMELGLSTIDRLTMSTESTPDLTNSSSFTNSDTFSEALHTHLLNSLVVTDQIFSYTPDPITGLHSPVIGTIGPKSGETSPPAYETHRHDEEVHILQPYITSKLKLEVINIKIRQYILTMDIDTFEERVCGALEEVEPIDELDEQTEVQEDRQDEVDNSVDRDDDLKGSYWF